MATTRTSSTSSRKAATRRQPRQAARGSSRNSPSGCARCATRTACSPCAPRCTSWRGRSVKKTVLSDDPTPIHYQQDASGKTPEKPAAQLATDREIEKFPFGAKGDADVQVVSVDRMFE